MKNKTAFLPIREHLCSIAAFLMSKSLVIEELVIEESKSVLAKLYIYCLCRSAVLSSICLASQYTRRFCARVDGLPPCCLATGRWGAARRTGRLDTRIAARDPAPCPLPGLMKNRQVDMTKIKSLLHKRQTSLCPGHESLTIVVLWFHWNVFKSFLQRPLPLLNKETVQEMVRTARRIGLIKSAQVVIYEKFFFFVPETSYVKNFP